MNCVVVQRNKLVQCSTFFYFLHLDASYFMYHFGYDPVNHKWNELMIQHLPHLQPELFAAFRRFITRAKGLPSIGQLSQGVGGKKLAFSNKFHSQKRGETVLPPSSSPLQLHDFHTVLILTSPSAPLINFSGVRIRKSKGGKGR